MNQIDCILILSYQETEAQILTKQLSIIYPGNIIYPGEIWAMETQRW